MMWVIVLFVAAMLLILAEFILPGGIVGTVGALFLMTSIGIAWYTLPEWALFITIGELIGAAICIGIGIYIISNTGAGKLLTLEESQRSEEGYTNVPTDESLVGRRGTAITTLRPAGTIEVNGERLDAVANGIYIEQGAPVEIVEVHGNRVVVEAVESSEETPATA